VAISGQFPTWLIVSALNEATPAVSVVLVVPPSVHELAIEMVSADPVPLVIVLP